MQLSEYPKHHLVWQRVKQLRDFLVEMNLYTEESVDEDIMPDITTEEELVEMEGIVYQDVDTNY